MITILQKKRGQTDDFEKKLNLLLDKDDVHEDKLVGIIYFIDPDLKKNKNYYSERIKTMKEDHGVEIHLFYGEEFFDYLNLNWNELLGHLKKWKKELSDIPEINFDKEAEKTFKEIKILSPQVYMKIFKNEILFNEIILTLFPEKKVLNLLLDYFESKSVETRYKTLHQLLKEML